MFDVERWFIFVENKTAKQQYQEKMEERREIIRGNLSYKFLWRGPIVFEVKHFPRHFPSRVLFYSHNAKNFPYSLITAFLHATFSQHRERRKKNPLYSMLWKQGSRSWCRSIRERFCLVFLLYTFIDPVFGWSTVTKHWLFVSRSPLSLSTREPFDCFPSSSAVGFQHRSADFQVFFSLAFQLNFLVEGK